jgi:MSHA biogenesis protein MshK
MAAYLTLGFTLAVLLGAPRGFAQQLSDPTRPPREILGGGADAFEPAPGYSPAQVVIVSKDRRQATINGQTVSLGGRYGDATVVRISDEEIVLQRPDSTQVIRLYSSVNRKMRESSEPISTKAAGRREDGTHEEN